MGTLIKTDNLPVVASKDGHTTKITVTTLGLEYGDSFRDLLSDLNLDVALLETSIAQETADRIVYVDNKVDELEAEILNPTSAITANIESLIDSQVADPTSLAYSSIQSTSISAVNTNFGLSSLKTNLESVFGLNASTVSTKLATYATNNDVGAIAQVKLDVNGNITGWTAVDSSAEGSAFKINADTFALSDATNSHTPFAIDAVTGLTQFNGIVSFTNTDMSGYDNNNVEGVSSQDVIDDINSGNTTTINGGKITTGSITADKIVTTGLVADNINASSTIVGNRIEGSTIVGAVIKASYLDLDGELEVLTNYYLLPGTDTSGIPADAVAEGRYLTNYVYSASHDSVYIEASDLYRIPSISRVYETAQTIDTSAGTWLYGAINAYDMYETGNNIKAVKKTPTVIASEDVLLLDYYAEAQDWSGYNTNTSYLTSDFSYTFYVGSESFTLSMDRQEFRTYFGGSGDPEFSGFFHTGHLRLDGTTVVSQRQLSYWVNTDDGTIIGDPYSSSSASAEFIRNGITYRAELFAEGPTDYLSLPKPYGDIPPVYRVRIKLYIVQNSSGYLLDNPVEGINLMRAQCNSVFMHSQTFQYYQTYSKLQHINKELSLNSTININNLNGV